MSSILRRSDYEDYLVHVYFGRIDDPMQACLRRAYLDFNRTLRDIAKLENNISHKATKVLKEMFALIQETNAPAPKQFDEWHRSSCDRLKATYRECGYTRFSVGHAQKWLNMTIKYIFVLGEARLPGFAHLYDLCHVPLDNILMDRLRADFGFQPLPCAWSKLDDYEIYVDRQQWVRNHFPLAPLDAEFCLWIGRPVSTTKWP